MHSLNDLGHYHQAHKAMILASSQDWPDNKAVLLNWHYCVNIAGDDRLGPNEQGLFKEIRSK